MGQILSALIKIQNQIKCYAICLTALMDKIYKMIGLTKQIITESITNSMILIMLIKIK